MTPLAQNGQQPGTADNIDFFMKQVFEPFKDDIGEIENRDIPELKRAQQSCLTSVDSGSSSARVQAESTHIMDLYAPLVNQIKHLKSARENQVAGSIKYKTVMRMNDMLKTSMTNFQNIKYEFEKKLKEQTARQFRIVRPDASEQEVRQAVEDPNGEVFAQALMQSDRRGQSQSTLNAVKSRNAAIQQIERDMMQLGEMFQQMNELVEQQEAAIENIEMKGEEVVENMDKGTEQLGTAITSARNARKWKWWCLGIVSMYYLGKVKSSLPLTDF
jgi:syntaxin 1B/2/3